jgi:hypothetical protein
VGRRIDMDGLCMHMHVWVHVYTYSEGALDSAVYAPAVEESSAPPNASTSHIATDRRPTHGLIRNHPRKSPRMDGLCMHMHVWVHVYTYSEGALDSAVYAPAVEEHLVLTASDFPSGHVADTAGMEIVLVGDSLAMVAMGMGVHVYTYSEGALDSAVYAPAVEEHLVHCYFVCVFITVLTASDFPSGHVADTAGMEIVLVGDSLAMVAMCMHMHVWVHVYTYSEGALDSAVYAPAVEEHLVHCYFACITHPYQSSAPPNASTSHIATDRRPTHGLIRNS